MSGSGNYSPRGCLHPLTQIHRIYCLLVQHRVGFPISSQTTSFKLGRNCGGWGQSFPPTHPWGPGDACSWHPYRGGHLHPPANWKSGSSRQEVGGLLPRGWRGISLGLGVKTIEGLVPRGWQVWAQAMGGITCSGCIAICRDNQCGLADGGAAPDPWKACSAGGSSSKEGRMNFFCLTKSRARADGYLEKEGAARPQRYLRRGWITISLGCLKRSFCISWKPALQSLQLREATAS